MSHFFAYIARMRDIRRWSLMRNTIPENDQEHAAQAAILAHALATIANERYGGAINADRAASLALYHDASEVITGDLATPIKYFNPDIAAAYKQIERIAQDKLIGMLPEELRAAWQPLLHPNHDSEEWRIVKAADCLCAYLKCVEELKAGNGEFRKAAVATLKKARSLNMPAVDHFLNIFAPSFGLTLDELN
ncbi:MAG: 5'-deoxynucleotidase [Oscillospiraceae bacterium]|jgi:5'-deoxynucleotidase|nr:5'-deoxynucleotidase [Oscillospiraceae bacterium]